MEEGTRTAGATGGIGFCGVLTILFIALKLCGVIDWQWKWILAPLWIPLLIVVVIIIFIILFLWKKGNYE